MRKIFFLGVLLNFCLAFYQAEVVTTIEGPMFPRQTQTNLLQVSPNSMNNIEESILSKFSLTTEQTENGWRMQGVPLSADKQDKFSSIYFSKLNLELDAQKNITQLLLYDQNNKPIIEMKNTYTVFADLYFPLRAEVYLPDNKIRTVTEYKNIQYISEEK